MCNDSKGVEILFTAKKEQQLFINSSRTGRLNT